MRTKRAQRRRAKAPKVMTDLPDPFSKNNPGIVAYEVAREEECPCCFERRLDMWQAQYGEQYNTKEF